MKVILTHEVTGLGTAGDVVDVKDGYARNFLFRRGLATAWTKGGQKQVDAIAKGRQVREVKSLEEAQSIKGNLESKAVTVTAHAAYVKPEGSAPTVKILHHAIICCARKRIWIQNPYFIPEPDAIDAMGEAVKRGVDVRVMMPATSGSDNPIDRKSVV